MNETLRKVQGIFRDVFEDDEIIVTGETSAADIDSWDSLMHVTLIVTVEKEFGMRFTSSQISRLENVGDLVALIDAAQSRG
jgi:acyl carrier protein